MTAISPLPDFASAPIAVIGLGYVGLPLAVETGSASRRFAKAATIRWRRRPRNWPPRRASAFRPTPPICQRRASSSSPFPPRSTRTSAPT